MNTNILVDLDSLFDTRLGLLYQMSKSAVEEALTGDYFTRKSNDFKGVEFEAFSKNYRVRNKGTLNKSVITSVVKLVSDYVKKIDEMIDRSVPYVEVTKVYINTYPYNTLNEKERKVITTALAAALYKERVPPYVEVHNVYLTPDELTPEYLKEKYSALILYDYAELLERQSALGNFDKSSCPDVTLYAPAINNRPDISSQEDIKAIEEEINIGKETPITIYRAIELMYAPYINLVFLPIEVFSIRLQGVVDPQSQ